MILESSVEKEKPRKSPKRKNWVGVSIMSTCAFLVVMLIFHNFIISRWIFGLFGVYVFALLVLLFTFGLLKHLELKYKVNKRYLILSLTMVLSLFTALHIAFTASQLSGSMIEYIIHGFENLTPGGFFFALPAFVLSIVLFMEGALILLGVVFIISAAFLTTFVITNVGENRVIRKLPKILAERQMAQEEGDPDLQVRIEQKYNELIEKQSRRRHDKNKSELGLDLEKYKEPEKAKEADTPVPLSKVEPPPSVIDEINQWSMDAAAAQAQLMQPYQIQPNQFIQPPPPPPPPPAPAQPMITVPRQSAMDTILPEKQKIHRRNKYVRPPIDLIKSESTNLLTAQQEALSKQHLLDNKLKEFGVSAKVTNFTVAPAVTRFEIQLDTGTRVSHVTALETDIAYVLGSSNVRMETTIEGKNAIGVEVPNKTIGMVSIKDLIASSRFMNHKSALAVAIGKNINDELVIADIASMPHLLIAGSTGSGKSVMLNTILTSLLFRAHPDDVKLILVDMKRVELNMYNEVPHMLVPRAIKEVTQTINALKWMQKEMTRRYDVLEGQGVNNIALYQSLPAYQSGQLERMPYIVMVIDEAADLLARGKKEVEDAIKSLSALARACGIHIILATQRPSVDVITAVIKTNFPVRIAFKVGSRGDSQTIINDTGAEKLVGRGDMLFVQEGYSQRVQGAFIELEETRRVMNFIRDNNVSDFDIDLEDTILNGPPGDAPGTGFGDNDLQRAKAQDPYFVPILKWIVREDNLTKTVSISNMQRQFSLGFSRAGKIMDQLTGMGYVSLGNGSKARDVLITREEVEKLYGE